MRAAFDDRAVPYRVESLPKSGWAGRLDRLLRVEVEYRFVPLGPSNPAALVALLEQYPDYTNPAEAKAELESLLNRLRSKAGLKPEA